MTWNTKTAKASGHAQANRLTEIARLRVIVGYLGEKAQYHWWSSEFFAATSSAFLLPVFSKTALLAQYHGVKEAARRVHDEYIGIGRVFHLFRLPESIEQAIFEILKDPVVTDALKQDVVSKETALAALQSFFDASLPLQQGPVQIGKVGDLDGDLWLSDAAGRYYAAFTAGSRSYPYFVDKTVA